MHPAVVRDDHQARKSDSTSYCEHAFRGRTEVNRFLPCLAAALVASLCSCTAARRTTISPDGSVVLENGGQLGGRYTIAYTRTPKGGVKFVEDIDNEKSLADTVQAAGLAYGALQVRLNQDAQLASETAIVTGAQKASVASEGIKASVEKAGIAAEVSKAALKAAP